MTDAKLQIPEAANAGNTSPAEALKTANSLASQMITVAAGLLTFTVTFVEKFSPKNEALSPPLSLQISWLCFVAAIMFGFGTSMAIVGTMNSGGGAYGSSIRFMAGLMLLSFLAGVIALIIAGGAITGPLDLTSFWRF
jgi:hypothetical protein